MASQYSVKDGQKVYTDRQLEPSHSQTDSQLGPSPRQAGSEDRYDIQWLENNKYDDSNKDYYVKYVEDESFRNFVKSLLDTVTGAKDGPVKKENILSLTAGGCYGKVENTVVEREKSK